MSAPLVPSPLDYLGYRKFVLYPAIANAGPNEWVRGRSSWSEAQFVNAISGQDVWIGWQYICGVSDRAGQELVVELNGDLEYREGNVGPRVQRVIQMPAGRTMALNLPFAKRRRHRGPAPVIGIKTQVAQESAMDRAGRIVLLIAVLSVIAGLALRLL